MSSPTLKIDLDAAEGEDARFDRFKLIGWWDQKKLAAAKVLVIGAGALGNEIIKNLAMLGIGSVLIADKDRIEHSNLSRSILYRAADAGKQKAAVAAAAAKQIYPQMRVHFFDGDVVHGLGAGVFRWADVVLGGLDNREARLSINRQCWRVGRPWIDGAIEQIEGCARVFVPSSDAAPCYECTMSERDWKLLQLRRSCNLLTQTEMETGKTPTTPTISSIIAGVQCQEAVKLLHGMDVIAGRGWVFSGLGTDGYQVEYQRKADCLSHDPLDEIMPLDTRADGVTIGDLLDHARRLAGPRAELELGRDMLEKLVCPDCGREEAVFDSLGRVPASRAICPHCHAEGKTVRRQVVTFDRVRGNEPFLDRSAAQIGVPPMDILTVRAPGKSIGLELAGDAQQVLGPLTESLETMEGLDWTSE
jgi:molybdopterin/thiamine biosynthesis adenylyltransferase